MARWMKVWNISLGTEGKERSLARELIGPNITSESVAFTFSLDGGGEELRRAPMAYVPDLPAKVTQLLEQNDRYFSIINDQYSTSIIIDWAG
jgi:hypothetical protein